MTTVWEYTLVGRYMVSVEIVLSYIIWLNGAVPLVPVNHGTYTMSMVLVSSPQEREVATCLSVYIFHSAIS